MFLGATVLCFLVLLALVADRVGGHVFHGESERVFYRCEACDLRYPRRELHDARLQICPAGHPVLAEKRRVTAGGVAIFACLGFLAVAIVLMLTGTVPA